MSNELRDSTVTPVPVSTSASHRHKLARARSAVATIPPTRVRGVLVIEPDPDLQWRLARMLTVRGNRVVGTSSAEAGLELMRQWPVDLVLVDDELDGMSGRELAEVVHERYPDTAVVLMAHGPIAAELTDRVAGAVATITKPFRPEALIELLRSFPKGEPELA